MLALSPPSLSTFGWPLEDPITHGENYYYSRETETSESLPNFPLTNPQIGICSEFAAFGTTGSDVTMVKKLNHNASERDRRKRINDLYSTLRSLLPATNQMKKLSLPATVSGVLKYIPELQKEVKRLVHKKEELSSKVITKKGAQSTTRNQRKVAIQSSLCFVSANQLSEGEIMIQISIVKLNKSSLSEVLLSLEEHGLLLLNATSLETFGERIFYNLHLQVQGTDQHKMDLEMLREKLLSLYERWEEVFP